MKHKIILLSGKQGSGKTTLADGLVLMAHEYGYVPVRTRFAKVLYEMHDAVLAVAKEYGIPVNTKEGEILQWLGTEWGRNLKGENVWVNALKTSIETRIAAQPDGSKQALCFIIDDMRFVNEFEAFADGQLTTDGSTLSVHKIRLDADVETRKARCSYWRTNDQHPSEIGLDLHASQGKFDTYIGTSGAMTADLALQCVVEVVFNEQ